MVGHLGGDGRVRVLYPETLHSSGWVAGGETIWLKPTPAAYDMAPHLYSFARTPYRNMAAMSDSYDGRGHGYVFILTSRYPLNLSAFAGNRAFETLEVQNYEDESDPRIAVRELADEVSSGPYTLKYAVGDRRLSHYSLATCCPSSWGLSSFDPYFDPWGWGYSLFGDPGFALVNALAFAHYSGYGSWCRGTYYAAFPTYRSAIYRPRLPPATPQEPVTPQLQRPTRRTLDNPERRGPLMSGFGSFGRRSSFDGERASRRPISTRPQSTTRSRGRDAEASRPRSADDRRPQRSSRPAEAPRPSRPAAPAQPPAPAAKGDDVKAQRPPKPQ